MAVVKDSILEIEAAADGFKFWFRDGKNMSSNLMEYIEITGNKYVISNDTLSSWIQKAHSARDLYSGDGKTPVECLAHFIFEWCRADQLPEGVVLKQGAQLGALELFAQRLVKLELRGKERSKSEILFKNSNSPKIYHVDKSIFLLEPAHERLKKMIESLVALIQRDTGSAPSETATKINEANEANLRDLQAEYRELFKEIYGRFPIPFSKRDRSRIDAKRSIASTNRDEDIYYELLDGGFTRRFSKQELEEQSDKISNLVFLRVVVLSDEGPWPAALGELSKRVPAPFMDTQLEYVANSALPDAAVKEIIGLTTSR